MENEAKIKKNVRESYGRIAENEGSCCGSGPSQCGDGTDIEPVDSRSIGYTDAQIKAVTKGSNLGLGCGEVQHRSAQYRKAKRSLILVPALDSIVFSHPKRWEKTVM
jgi:hypothetical protein